MLELGQGQAAAPAGGDLIKDVGEADFMTEVVEASRKTPVIVDFWAPWCGPCKQLTPALEQAVRAANGKVRLVKVNVDENQMIAGQLRVQSIPTVYAFVDGHFVPNPNFKPPKTEPKPQKQTPRTKAPRKSPPAPAPSPTDGADGAIGVQRGDILSGEVVGYIKDRWGRKISAKVRLDWVRETDEPRRPGTGEFQPGTIVAELPQEEVSLLERWAGEPTLDKRVELGTRSDFQVLEVACGGRVTVSQKSYLQRYFNRLLQQWAGFEDHKYAYVREEVNPELNATEAMVEAARLSRDHFKLWWDWDQWY